MSLINPVNPRRDTGDEVTARARPKPARKGAPLRDRLAVGGRQPSPIPEPAIAVLATMQGLQAELLAQLAKLNDEPPVFTSGTFNVEASGTWRRNFQVQYKSVHVVNLAANPMVCMSGPPNDPTNPQTSGPGVIYIPGQRFVTAPLIGNQVSIVGPANAQFRIVVMGCFVPPNTGYT